jgi:hypothetical protein
VKDGGLTTTDHTCPNRRKSHQPSFIIINPGSQQLSFIYQTWQITLPINRRKNEKNSKPKRKDTACIHLNKNHYQQQQPNPTFLSKTAGESYMKDGR